MANDLKLQVLLNAIDKATGPLKKINNSSLEAARGLKAARDKLKELNAQQKDVSAWRTQRAAAEQTEQAMAAARDKVKALSQQFAATGAPTKAMAKDFRVAVREAQRLKQAHEQQSLQLHTLRTRLQASGISTKNLSSHERQLREQINATNSSISEQGRRLSTLNQQRARAAKARVNFDQSQQLVGGAAVAGASSGAAGAAAALPILSMVKSYSSYEDAMAGVAKQVEGARDESGQLTKVYYDMGAAIKKMAETIPMATTEIAALVEGGARMGIKGQDDLLEFARVAATAATAFELPADQIGEDMARIAQLYKLPIKNIGQLGDAINYLDDESTSKGADIIDVMQRTAGVTASVDMSFKEAAALGSTFLTLGASAEVAASATNAMIRELAIANLQPERFQQGLKAIGMEATTVQANMAKDATGTIKAVMDGIKKLPQADQLGVATLLFGKEYGDDAAKLAENMGEYRRQLELVNGTKGNGSMDREADIRAQALSARKIMSDNRLFNLSSALGETLKPTIIELLDLFNDIIEKVNTWATANPELVATLLKVTAGAATFCIVLGTVAIAFAGLWGPIAMLRFGLSMLGLGGKGAGKTLTDLAAPSKILSQGVFPKLTQGIRTLASTMSGALVTALRTVSTALWGLARNPVALAIAAIVLILAGAAYLIYKNWDAVKLYFANAWTEIKAGFSGGIGGILTTLANFSPIGLIYQAFAGVLSYLGVDLPSRFTEFGNMIVNGLVSGLFAGMGQIKGAITSIGDSTIGWFKEKLGIHSPSRVFAELGGFTMAGLTQGLEGGQQGPLNAVNTLGQQLAAAGGMTLGAGAVTVPTLAVDQRPPISASSAPVQSSQDTYEFHIHAAPGMDPQAIAQAVRAELARVQSEKSARQRSQLSDQE
ncbi:phage tail tape measure protein [Pseudomonas sp. NPDC098747]|uniref:phage tail tape measure protein n=1 Tax=Pseudomonas sp. NPDC098747 TaxID=3364487 RepID=UPI00383B5E5A